MPLENFYYFSQIIAAFAIVFSLAFAGLQIGHAARATRAQTEQSISNSWLSVAAAIAADVGPFNRGLTSQADDISDLSADDRMAFIVLIHAYFRHYENIFMQARRGYIDREIWTSWSEHMKLVLTYPGVRNWWRLRGRGFAPAFQEIVAASLSPRAPRPTPERPSGLTQPPSTALSPSSAGPDCAPPRFHRAAGAARNRARL